MDGCICWCVCWLVGWLVGGSLVDIVINVTNNSENAVQEVGRLFFSGSIDYFGEQRQFHKLSKDLRDEDEYLSKHSVENWYEKYIDWASTNIPQDINNASKYQNLDYADRNKGKKYDKCMYLL